MVSLAPGKIPRMNAEHYCAECVPHGFASNTVNSVIYVVILFMRIMRVVVRVHK